jgi:hypothetical protein
VSFAPATFIAYVLIYVYLTYNSSLVDLCVKHCCSNDEGTSKRMCVLTFIRTMLVYQRVIRWYRKVYEEEPERLASSKVCVSARSRVPFPLYFKKKKRIRFVLGTAGFLLSCLPSLFATIIP